MRRALPLLLATVCLAGGCRTDTPLGGYLFYRSHNFSNNRANQAYQQALTEHARDQSLLGTWTRENAHHLEGHPDLILSDTRWDLSLFEDGTYSVRREGLQVGSDFFTNSSDMFIAVPLHTIATQEGLWAKASPGVIELRDADSDEAAEPTTLDLSDWTNTFVVADRSLHE